MFAQHPIACVFVASKGEGADVLVDVVEDPTFVRVPDLLGDEGEEGVENEDKAGTTADRFGEVGCLRDRTVFVVTSV